MMEVKGIEVIEDRTWFGRWYQTCENTTHGPWDMCPVCWIVLKDTNWISLWNHCLEQHSDTMVMARLAYTNEPIEGSCVYLMSDGHMRWEEVSQVNKSSQ